METNAMNGGIWWKIKILSYKHAIAGFPSQIAYGGGVTKI